jgi:transcriptional regulator with XRE-family HTH domain/tetratricopeptide (TPR) repeat protein
MDPVDPTVALAAELRRLRLAQGLTQEELAARAGLSDRTVRNIERGHRRPRLPTLRLLGTALMVSRAEQDALEATVRRAYWSSRTEQPATDRPVGQLPPDIAEFVGRERELAEVLAAADRRSPTAGPVVVIEGMAGVGKTRLALRAAHELGADADVQLYADLRGDDPAGARVAPAEALGSFLRTLGVPPTEIPDELVARAAAYRERLRGRSAVVVLDNASDGEQIGPLLPGGPDVLVIVTSRRSTLVLDGAVPVVLDVFSPAEASAYVDRVVGPERTAAEPAGAGRLAAACGHLPLALALVARRVRSRPGWSIDEQATRLQREQASATGPPLRVRTAFDWSYRELSPQHQRLFRLLGTHPGDSASTPSVAALAGLSPDAAEHLLEDLIDEHLVEPYVAGRVRLHDLLRSYARSRAISEESDTARRRAVEQLLSWYLDATLAAHRQVSSHTPVVSAPEVRRPARFSSRTDALDWWRLERPALIRGVEAAERAGLDRLGWQLAAAMVVLLQIDSRPDEQVATYRAGVAAADRDGDPVARATMLSNLGTAHLLRGDRPEAERCWHAALDVSERAGDIRLAATVLGSLATAHADAGRPAEAVPLLRRSLDLAVRGGFGYVEKVSRTNLGLNLARIGRAGEGVEHLESAIEARRRDGDRFGEGYALEYLGEAHQALGEPAEALRRHRLALRIRTEIGHQWGIAKSSYDVGAQLCADGELAEGAALLREAAERFDALNDPLARTARDLLRTCPS